MLENIPMSYAIFIVALYGLIVGSFLNVVIYRVPKKESIMFSSCCQKCKNKLKWWHNIPLFSWLGLRGKCYYCSEKISIQYPLIEFFMSFIFFITFIVLGRLTYLFFLVVSFVAVVLSYGMMKFNAVK